MSNQGMQFADPDWQPTQSGLKSADEQQSPVYTPQPINDDRREQFHWHISRPVDKYWHDQW